MTNRSGGPARIPCQMTKQPEDPRFRYLRLTNALRQRWKDLHELEQQAGIAEAFL